MNNQLQMYINTVSPGVLMLDFPGRTSPVQMNDYYDQIETAFKRERPVKKMVFNLNHVDPVNNMVGRVFDLALTFKKKRRVPNVEICLTEEIYKDLQELETERLPEIPNREEIDGIRFILAKALIKNRVEATERVRPTVSVEKAKDARIILACLGKIRGIHEENVTVSLFTESGEIVGELHKDQFSSSKLTAGQMFRYEAMKNGPGKTQISIEDVPEREIGTNEIVEIWNKINESLPNDDF
jgi:hypothetical protein